MPVSSGPSAHARLRHTLMTPMVNARSLGATTAAMRAERGATSIWEMENLRACVRARAREQQPAGTIQVSVQACWEVVIAVVRVCVCTRECARASACMCVHVRVPACAHV